MIEHDFFCEFMFLPCINQASTLSQYQMKNSSKNADTHEDFFAKQARLKAEAKLALAQVCRL